LHLHPYKSKACLWRERLPTTGLKLLNPPTCTAMAHGNTYERDAVEAALGQIGGKYTDGPELPWCTPGIILGRDGITCCSPDALWKDQLKGTWHGLEVKCPFNPDNVPTPTSYRENTHYILQAFHCLHTCEALDWHLFWYDPRNLSNRLLIKVHRNEKTWQKLLSHYRNFLALGVEPGRKSKFDRWMGETLFSEIRTEVVEV